MQEGKRKLQGSTLLIRPCTALPVKMRASTRELVSLHTDPAKRGQGFATSLMHRTCREADAAGVTLVLWPKSFGEEPGPDDDKLVTWYQSFGFQVIQSDPRLMARMPGSTPRFMELTPMSKALFLSKKAP